MYIINKVKKKQNIELCFLPYFIVGKYIVNSVNSSVLLTEFFHYMILPTLLL